MNRTKSILGVGALVLVALGTILAFKHHFQTERGAEQARSAEAANSVQSNALPQSEEQRPPPTARLVHAHPPNPHQPAPRMLPKPQEQEITELVNRLLNGEEVKLSRAQAESYLEKNGRTGPNLIAAFIATYDQALLQEALETSPKDPIVNLVNYCSALLGEGSPEERRQRLEDFKQAAPDNPLGNYLSAYEYFHAGQADQAVQDLQAAYGKGTIEDYRLGLFGDLEKLYLQAGYSDSDASSIAGATPIPFLRLLKLEGSQLTELAGLYRQSGDELSALASMQIGLDLGERLAQVPDYPMANLTGLRLQLQLLQGMDPASAYGPNGLTVRDRLAALTQREQGLVQLGQQSLSPEDRANGRLWFPLKTLAQGQK